MVKEVYNPRYQAGSHCASWEDAAHTASNEAEGECCECAGVVKEVYGACYQAGSHRAIWEDAAHTAPNEAEGECCECTGVVKELCTHSYIQWARCGEGMSAVW